MIPQIIADGVPEPDDDQTNPGNRTVVGVPPIGQTTSTRRPWRHMSPWLVEFAREFCAVADLESAVDLRASIMSALGQLNHELTMWMEMACSHVILLGYQPAECTIAVQDRPRRMRHVLRVGPLECFEVTIARHWDGVRTVVTTTPRVIAWPQRRA